MKKYWLLGLGLLAATSAWGIKAPTTLEGAKLSNGTLSGAITASSATISSPTVSAPTLTGTVGASAATITSPTISNPTFANSVTISAATVVSPIVLSEIASPSTPNSGTGKLFASSADNKLYFKNSAGVEVAMGTGSGGINYISLGDAENNATTGWSVYRDTPVGATPSPTPTPTAVPTSLSLATTSGSPIRGSYSFALSKAASNGQGEQISYPFTIANGDQARVMSVEFAYTVSAGTYTAETSTTNPELIAYVIDQTNLQAIQLAPYKIVACTTGTQCRFQGEFQTASNSTSYRLVLHQSLTGTNSYTILLDDFKVGPSIKSFGAPISDWQSYTPTGGWNTNVEYTGRWRRVGDSAEIDATVTCSGNPNSASLTFTLPSGLTADTSKMSNSDTSDGAKTLGYGTADDLSTKTYFLSVKYASTTSVMLRVINTASTYGEDAAITQAVPFTFANGDRVHVTFRIPIQGWSSATQISDNADTRVVAASAYRATTGQTVTAGAPIAVAFNTVRSDSHGTAMSASTGVYTVPVPGDYEVSYNLRVAMGATAASQVDTYVLKNGTGTTYIGTGNDDLANSKQYTFTASGVIRGLVAGDTLSVYINPTGQNVTISSSNNDVSAFYVRKLSGPSSIAASETVAVKASNTAGTTLTKSADNTVPFATEDVDTHGAWVTDTFTAPVAGVYQINANVYVTSGATWAAADQMDIQLKKNTTAIAYVSTTITASSTAGFGANASTVVRLVAGDTITVHAFPYKASAGNVTLNTTAGINTVSIVRIGL